MKNKKIKYYLSVLFRAMTLFSKFLLIIMLAKLIPGDSVGLYGLVSAAVSYAIFVVGFEFYTFSTREMIAHPREYWRGMIKSQTALAFLVYFIFIPVIFFIYKYNILPKGTELWFISLLFFEHISQEINRILIVAQNQLLASVVLFIRQGMWCWIVVGLMLIKPAMRSIEIVFILWLSSAMLASCIGGFYIVGITRENKDNYISWTWVKRGVKLSLPMLAAALAMRGIFTFDKFTVENISGLAVVGAYTLFISMTSAIQSFLDTILIAFSFPKIATLAAQKKYADYFNEVNKFARQVIGLSFALCSGCWISGYVVVSWINKSEYTQYFPLFGWLVVATFIYCLSLIPHLALYSLKEDKVIVISQTFILSLFVVFLFAAYWLSDIYIISFGMIISFSILLMWKSIAYICIAKKIKKTKWSHCNA